MRFNARPKTIRRPFLAALTVCAIALAGAVTSARAQDGTVFIGGRGGNPIDVDLGALSAPPGVPGSEGLLFPGSRDRPGQPLVLSPPGAQPARLRKPKRKTAKRRPRREARTAARSSAPSAAPAAPPPPPLLTAPRAKPTPAPKKRLKRVAPSKTPTPAMAPPPAKAPRRAPTEMASAPIPAPPKAERKPAPPTRLQKEDPSVSLPPPPPPLPPVTAAPRTPVTTAQTTSPRKPAAKSTPSGAQVARLPADRQITSGFQRRVLFPAGSQRLTEDSQAALGQIAAALKKNPTLRLRLVAYAKGNAQNASQARRLSLSRALAVRANLMKQGVEPTRMDVQALGHKISDGAPDRVDLIVSSR